MAVLTCWLFACFLASFIAGSTGFYDIRVGRLNED